MAGPGHPPEGAAGRLRLRLFVAGHEPNSANARRILARLAATRLAGRCELVVVDVLEDYQAALEHGIIAVPAVVVEEPGPRRVIIGSLGDEETALRALGVGADDLR